MNHCTRIVPIVIQMACLWGEHSLPCPSLCGPGLSQVAIVPCFCWVTSFTSPPCSLFCDPDSLFTSCVISVFISRSSSEGSYSTSTSSNTSCTSRSSFSLIIRFLFLFFQLFYQLFPKKSRTDIFVVKYALHITHTHTHNTHT